MTWLHETAEKGGAKTVTLNDADAYHFELQFRLPRDQRIWSEDSEIGLGTALGTDRLSLRTRDGGKLRESMRLSLFGFGYTTIEQAHEGAGRARRALVFAAIESNVAIEWRDSPPTRPGGLSVWQGHRAVFEAEFGGSANLITGANAEVFRDRLISRLVTDIRLTERQRNCCDLLLGFEFDLNARSRLILAMSAIEQIARGSLPKNKEYQSILRELRTKLAEVASVSDAIRSAKSELDRDLKNLAFESPRGRCMRLIGARLGEADVQEFNTLSGFRNKVAHEGLSGEEGWTMASRGFDLARRLLFADIAAESQGGAGAGS